MIPLAGFCPDLDPTTPGVLTDCSQVIPFEAGMKGAPSLVSVGINTLAAACRGAVSTLDLSGNRRLIAGTSTHLYEVSGTAWSDISRGALYSLGSDDRWSFAQFANATLAVTPTAIVQRSISGAFADVAGSPQAKMIVVASNFAVAFNTNATTDTWYCSAYLDETNWTLSLANQCVTGRLIGGGGPITAALRFGDDIAVYKAGSVFIGRYTGAPEVWKFTQLSNDIGCVGQDAVVETVLGHIFVGKDNVYLFDGTVPRPLQGWEKTRRWLFNDISTTYLFKTTLQWDRANHLVRIFYASTASTGSLDSCIVYHVLTNQWGRANTAIEAVISYTAASMTYDGGSPLVTTYDTGPTTSFDSLIWISGSTTPAVFDSTHTLTTLAGATGSAYFVTGDNGDDQGYTFVDAVRVRYTAAPTTSSATGYVKDQEGLSVVTAQAASTSEGKHNMRQRGRFHRFRFDTTGSFQATAYRVQAKPAGER